MNVNSLRLGVVLVVLPVHAAIAAVINVENGAQVTKNNITIDVDKFGWDTAAILVSGEHSRFTSEEGLNINLTQRARYGLVVDDKASASITGATFQGAASLTNYPDFVAVYNGGSLSLKDSIFKSDRRATPLYLSNFSNFTASGLTIESTLRQGGITPGIYAKVDNSLSTQARISLSDSRITGLRGLTLQGANIHFEGRNIFIDVQDSAIEHGISSNGASIELYNSTIKATKGDGLNINALYNATDRRTVYLENVEAEGDLTGLTVFGHYNVKIVGGRYTGKGDTGEAMYIASKTTKVDISNADFVSSTGGGVVQIPVNNFTGSFDIRGSSIETRGNNGWGLYAGNLINADRMTIMASGKNAGGAAAAAGGTLNLSNSVVTTQGAESMGLMNYSGSTTRADAVSVITQGENSHALYNFPGVMDISASRVVAEGKNSAALRMNGNYNGASSRVVLDSTYLESQQWLGVHATGSNAQLSLTGSVLKAGNGIALSAEKRSFTNTAGDVKTFGSLLDVRLDGSQVWGDVEADDLSTLDLSLSNGSLLTGSARNAGRLTLDQSSAWQVTGNSTLQQLDHQGTVGFLPGGDFKTLEIKGDLSGTGVFNMNTDLAALKGDLIRVGGQVEGEHTLVVADSGHSPNSPGGTLILVEGGKGSGQFQLFGGKVDAGTYRYTLEKEGDNWQLAQTGFNAAGGGGDLSTGSNAALGSQSALGLLWRTQNNSLITRLGELRLGHDQGGLWSRGVSKKFNASPSRSRGFSQKVEGFEIGADTALAVDNGRLYLGALVGLMDSTQDFQGEAKGTIDSKLVGVYGSYLHDSGYYADVVARYSWMDNDLSFSDNLGSRVKGDYRNQGFGGGVEVGKRFELSSALFIEPQAELTYIHNQSASYSLSNGLEIKQSSSESLEGRIGVLAGQRLEWSDQKLLQPYVKASVINELHHSGSTRFNQDRIAMNSGASRVELGLGASMQATEKSKISVDADYAKGSRMEMPWAVTLGYRILW